MTEEHLLVKCHHDIDTEEAYFKEQDEKVIKEFRKKALAAANEKYSEEHKYHCFRCGTKSLVEVDRGDIKIDICVNEGCGAVHLDPGELEQILQDKKSISSLRKCLLAVFK